MLARLRSHWPLAAALGVFWGVFAWVLAASLQLTQGHFVYTLDDPYIHMAIAKHLAGEGVWGVTRYEFSSAASSLLWPLLVALVYLVTGVVVWVPLVLNLLFGSALLAVAYGLLRRAGAGTWYAAFALVLITLLGPLPALVTTGMEHLLQGLLAIGFLFCCARVLAAQKPARLDTAALLALAPLVTATRYEDAFLVAPACLLLAVRRRGLLAACVAGLALLPVALYGRISFDQGWNWLPNSVLLKGLLSHPAATGLGQYLAVHLLQADLFWVFLGAGVVFALGLRPRGFWHPGQLLLALFLGAALLHLLTQYSTHPRYEAYLVVLGLLAVAAALPELLAARLQAGRRPAPVQLYAAALLALFLLLPTRERLAVNTSMPRASANVYQQQYQMARFLRTYYQGAAVAVNDIGAVSYYADLHLLDLWGLGSNEVAQSKLTGRYSRPHIDQFSRHRRVKIAILYDAWYRPALPTHWVRTGTWTIPENVVCGDPTVSFYAVDPAEAPQLLRHLQQFGASLPTEVDQQLGLEPVGQ